MRAPGTVQAAAAVLQQQQQQQQATQGQVQSQNIINNSMTAPQQVMAKKLCWQNCLEGAVPFPYTLIF